MCPLLSALLTFLMTLLGSRLALQLEIVALRPKSQKTRTYLVISG